MTLNRFEVLADWSEVPPQDYLKPFLAVIQSGETGGQITAVALSAVARILNEYVIGAIFKSNHTNIRGTNLRHALPTDVPILSSLPCWPCYLVERPSSPWPMHAYPRIAFTVTRMMK